MAEALNAADLRGRLRSSQLIQQDGFGLLKQVASFVNADVDSDLAREMVLRALDQQQHFGNLQGILDSLARAAGLFPYMNVEALDLRDSIAYEFHRPLNMAADLVFHREQAKVYHRLIAGDSVVLSAPTSFGKSKIIDALIANDTFDNIVLIVPTLSLIDETRRRLSTAFSNKYKIVTHLSQEPAARNVFVFTAERAIAYENFPDIDFLVIDEFYKLDPGTRDDSRAVALSQAFYKLRKGGTQFYLLGPNIDRVPPGVESNYGCYFYQTNYSTVVSEQTRMSDAGDELDRLANLAQTLDEPTLIFCSSPQRVNTVARLLVERGIGIASPTLQGAADWAARTHHPDWTFCKAITQGIGIHHGRLPRALAQYVVRMFNEEKLRFLVCTSTLIEGVNTKAKNVVILDNTIAQQQIDYFTFNNIKGRSGRMGQHFIGHVYLFHDPPQQSLPFVDFPMLTQPDSTPTSLLVQLDEGDLKESSQERVQSFFDEGDLPLAVIRLNSGINPEHQVELARFIRKNAQRLWPTLEWTNAPNGRQLRGVCELIWKFFVRTYRMHGVFSGSQLSFRTFQLQFNRDVSVRVRDELKPGQYMAKSVDEAVERILEFDRNWAGFKLPTYLMAVSRIQSHVLTQLNLPAGDYQGYVSRVECLFSTPVVAALDEYGIPMQLGERLQRFLGTADDLDLALRNLKAVDITSIKTLTPFERELLSDAQEAL